MKKPSVAWVIDRRGWAQDRRGMGVAANLPEFEFRMLTLKEFSRPWHRRVFDVAVFASWRTVKRHMEVAEAFGLERCLCGVGSHYEIGPGEHSLPKGCDPHRVRCEAIETLRQFRIVLAHSRPLYDILCVHVPQTTYAPNGVDVEFFRPAGERRGGSPYMIGWLGREKAAKNLPLLRAVTSAPATSDVNFDVCLIGRNAWPYLGQANVRHKYQWTWDFSLNVSHSEGFSNVLLESASCGVPAITVDVGDHCQLVEDGKTGFVVEPTIQSVSECLKRLRHLEVEDYRRMSQNIRAEVEAHWTWKQRAEPYRKALEVVCA